MSWVNHQHNQSTHVTAYRDVTLCKSPTGDKCSHRSSVPNCAKPKILRCIWKWSKFWSHIKVKSCKNNLHKVRPACIPSYTLVTLLKEVINFLYVPRYLMSYCCIPLVLWCNHWKEKVLQLTWLKFNLSFQKTVCQGLEVMKVMFWVFNSHTRIDRLFMSIASLIDHNEVQWV